MNRKTTSISNRTGRWRRESPAWAVWVVLACCLVVGRRVEAAGDTARGRELFALAAGCGCHTPERGPAGAGGSAIKTPFGTFYATNITSDREHGIGAWSDAEIEQAIRGGYVRGRGVEAPVMPYYAYAGMIDSDVADLIAFLRTLPPSTQANRAHEGELPLARAAYRVWRLLFAPAVRRRAQPPAPGIERGRYFADHVAICGDCHTPRNRLGVPRADLYLAGNTEGPEGETVPNITPHASGIESWDAADMLNLLQQGMLPNFDNVQGMMADVIDGHGGGLGYKHAPADALRDIAEYLKSVPAIDNVIPGK